MNTKVENEKVDNVKVDVEATTVFVDNSETTQSGPFESIASNTAYVPHQEISDITMIQQFLAKPVELQVGQFNITDTSTTFTTLHSLPYAMVSKPIYATKLRGYLGMRATIVLTLQVNAQRFQQGRYMLVYVPCGGTRSSVHADNWVNKHFTTRVNRSQCLHAEIDLNTQTSVTLRIPYNSSYDFYSLQYSSPSDASIWGRARIFPYSPLESSGTPTAKFTLWAHFEDLELIGQTVPFEEQSNSSREQKSKDIGPVESTALRIKRATNKYFSKVPLMQSFIGPVSWASDITAGVASVFGWSAPANVDKQYRVEQSIMSYATNINKSDKVNPMSLTINPSVKVMPGNSLTDADEMDIAYISQIYSFQDIFAWSPNDAEDALIKRYYVGLYPLGAPVTHVDSGVTYQDLTPAQYIGTRFGMWRGSVRMKFKFVKTEFHSGRFSINFDPRSPGLTPVNIVNGVSPYVQRHIVDVREISEIELVFPYINVNPYKNTYNNGETHFGFIDIRVIDPLVSPDSVWSSIKIIMEHSLGPDAEFAGRIANETIMKASYEVQSYSATIGSSKMPDPDNLNPAEFCIGERIKSLRALSRRYEMVRYLNYNLGTFLTTDSEPQDVGCYHTFLPFAVQNEGRETEATIMDFYSQLGSIYLFFRGGVRVKALFLTGNRYNAAGSAISNNSAINMRYASFLRGGIFDAYQIRRSANRATGTLAARQPVPSVFYGLDGNLNAGQFNVQQADRDQEIALEVPQHHHQHSRNNVVHVTSTLPYSTNIHDEVHDGFVAFYTNELPTQNTARLPWFALKTFRATADDGDFSCFVSIPPMEVIAATNLSF